jgi:hypothetical protein
MIHLCQNLISEGFKSEELFVDESAPDRCVQLQAEVMQDERYIYIRYAIGSGVGMRQAYPTMQHAFGLKAITILKQYLDAPSLDELFRILKLYNSSVVELSSYDRSVGVLKLNTIFWEVRCDY